MNYAIIKDAEILWLYKSVYVYFPINTFLIEL